MSDRSVEVVGRQERKRLATRKSIFDSAIHLFREKGYQATTVEEIAAKADVAKATFFKHFPKKYELIEEMIKQRRDKIELAAVDEQVGQLAIRDQVRYLMIVLCQSIETDRALAIIALNEYLCSGEMLKDESPMIELFHQTLERGKRGGELRQDIPTRVVARMLWSYYLESYIAWSRDEQGQSLESMILEGVEVIFRGIEDAEA
ncbi:TetR/AcrR family transcriptional regulator [Brevibacillus centrosporus]|uniref:TetR/AcrR family transcriptional regulator n=1 Tax=Brevibacillus centrosporus TaxID=54910 RepID=UPI003B01D043